MSAQVRVWRSVGEIPVDLGPTVVTIGVFDGVHRGHHAVVQQAAKHAARLAVPLVVVTFAPHPLSVVRPQHAPPPAVATLEHRIDLLAAAGADGVLVVHFDSGRAAQSAEDFVAEVLVDALHAKVVVVGEDFRFGYRAAGDVALLRTLGARDGFIVEPVAPQGDASAHRWSSTYVRDRVVAGDVEDANRALGHLFRVEGVVVEGDKRGRELGYPTANVPASVSTLVPADGVYAGWLVRLDEEPQRLAAAISVGTNPTFDGKDRRVESYVIDRTDLELYGVPVAVDFVARLRGQVRYEGIEPLLVQMAKDVQQARELLA